MKEIMTAKARSVKRYVVRLSAEERQRLEAMIRKGKSPAQREHGAAGAGGSL
jgi:hypothetical protein